MSNPFTVRDRKVGTLKKGEPITEVISELWSFYQFLMSDDEIRAKFEAWKTYETLKEEHDY